jgi:hypothetical protein
MDKFRLSLRKSVLLVSMIAATTSCDRSIDLTGPASSPSTATIEIRSTGLDNHYLLIAPSGRVTFRNRDAVPHQIASDTHPDHQQCPQLNGPLLAAGESFSATMPQENRTSCGYHDEQRPNDPSFRGTIDVCREFGLFGCR